MLMRNFQHPGPRQPAQAGDKNPRQRTPGEQLLAEIEAFMRRNPRYTQNRVGREAVGNDALIRRLQEGLDPEEVTCRRVRRFIAENGR
jgi:hypothetical protein